MPLIFRRALRQRALDALNLFTGAFVPVFLGLIPTQAAPAEPTAGTQPHPVIHWRHDPGRPNRMFVEVSALDREDLADLKRVEREASDWGPRWLSVFADQEGLSSDARLPAMWGTYGLRTNSLVFLPQFPLQRGVRYRAVFKSQTSRSGAEILTSVFTLTDRALKPTAVVSAVYPSAGVLPENLLKFYLQFSVPMSGGHSYDHIHLVRGDGSEVEYPFLRLDEELWDPAMRRLTVLIDPGRIKRGVQPNETLGPSLTAGKRFTLVIDSAWQDAAGTPLKESFRRSFQVGPAERSPLDTARWKIDAPRAGTRGPLTLGFPRPMDHALAQHAMGVFTRSGARIAGAVRLLDHEQRWQFVPDVAWKAGPHELRVQTTLEDLAGNNIGKAFEVDVFERVDRQVTRPSVTLAFDVLR